KHVVLPWKNNKEDEDWLHPDSENFYHQIDHFHLPSVDSPTPDRWAEWHYFNFESQHFYGYLSVMVAGDLLKEQANWIVSLQIVEGGHYKRYFTTIPATVKELPLERVDYSAGDTKVRFVKDHYEIGLNFKDKAPITANLKYYPVPNLYFPPT